MELEKTCRCWTSKMELEIADVVDGLALLVADVLRAVADVVT